jgi:hypothetical protein
MSRANYGMPLAEYNESQPVCPGCGETDFDDPNVSDTDIWSRDDADHDKT